VIVSAGPRLPRPAAKRPRGRRRFDPSLAQG